MAAKKGLGFLIMEVSSECAWNDKVTIPEVAWLCCSVLSNDY